MKVVIDNNIFVSAMFGGKPEAVVERIFDELDHLFLTVSIIAEIEKTFNKPEFKKPKYNITQERIDIFLSDIKALGHIVTVFPEHYARGACKHTADNKYLECAVAAKADYIISGDKDLRELKEYKGIKIVNAAEYLEIVNP
jgi:putative PIN family toxin of toxin-antitoxin system